MRLKIFFLFLMIGLVGSAGAQSYNFINGKSSQSVDFELINNLIVLPIEVNGTELTFILDTGVASPVIFNMTSSDSLEFKEMKFIKLRGLGKGESVEAIRSNNNSFKFGNIIGENQDLFIVHNDKLDLSGKLGVTVNGIIGYSVLKDFIVTINYVTRKLTFTDPNSYSYKKCRSCETFDLFFYKNKPFIDAEIEVEDTVTRTIPVQLLIDSGGTDSLWLFEDDAKKISIPKASFEDFIGEGISGAIFGMRSKIKSFRLKRFVFENPNVAYLDSVSTAYARGLKTRNGSLGGNILKRFKIIMDYGNKKITLKPNKNYDDIFAYNMSGIELIHGSKELVKEVNRTSFDFNNETSNSGNASGNTITFNYSYSFNLRPTYRIAHVRKGSPAEKCGLIVGDVVIRVNGKRAYNYDLKNIVSKFYGPEEKWLRLTVIRNGMELDYSFKLKNLLHDY